MAEKFKGFIFLIILVAIIVFVNDNFLHLNFYNNLQNKSLDQNLNLAFDYKVSHVVDGDTIDIKKLNGDNFENGKDVIRLRLLGINTPETVAPDRPVECFGREASDEVKSLAEGQTVAIETDETQGLLDKYGRELAYVYVKTSGLQGSNYFMLNEKLIEDGYAFEYTYSTPYKYQALFKEAQAQANSKDLGLWNQNTCNGLKTPVASQ